MAVFLSYICISYPTDADIESATEDTCTSATASSSPPRKLLRSSVPPTKPGHILPAECIICRRVQWIINRQDRKRHAAPLVTCERINADVFLKAAELRNNSRILTQIRGKDLVAIEVRYHKSCYREFVRCITDKARRTKDVHDESHELYNSSFQHLCDVVQKRIICGKELLRLTTLKETFVRSVRKEENLDASSYKTTRLKQRLQDRFPVINFC